MVGIKTYASKLVMLCTNVQMPKTMEISLDAPMNFMHMKCGAQMTSEECIPKNLDKINLNPKFTIENRSQNLTKANKQSLVEDGSTNHNDLRNYNIKTRSSTSLFLQAFYLQVEIDRFNPLFKTNEK